VKTNQLVTTRICLLVCAMGLFQGVAGHGQIQVTGRIVSPKDGEPVFSDIPVSGTVRNVGRGLHLWLVLRKGGLLWPKGPEIEAVGESWSATVSEGGTPAGGRFNLVLLAVNDAGQKQITEWIRAGDATGSFPGLKAITGANELHAVMVRMR
jgi:hypothetical protein